MAKIHLLVQNCQKQSELFEFIGFVQHSRPGQIAELRRTASYWCSCTSAHDVRLTAVLVPFPRRVRRRDKLWSSGWCAQLANEIHRKWTRFITAACSQIKFTVSHFNVNFFWIHSWNRVAWNIRKSFRSYWRTSQNESRMMRVGFANILV